MSNLQKYSPRDGQSLEETQVTKEDTDDIATDPTTSTQIPDRPVTSPQKFGETHQTSAEENEGMFVENQYGEMQPTDVTPQHRWGHGGIPELNDGSVNRFDRAIGAAQEALGKMLNNQQLEDKGIERQTETGTETQTETETR